MIKTISYCIALGLTLSAGATLLPEEQVIENVQSIIVQGASQSIMEQNITAAGGEVLHSFSVIEAVSAQLTEQQIEQMKSSNPMLRFFTDSEVKISKKDKTENVDNAREMSNSIIVDTQKPLQYDLNTNTVIWGSTNRFKTEYKVEQVEISWPASNGALTLLDVVGIEVDLDRPKKYTLDLTSASASVSFVNKRDVGITSKQMSVTMAFENLSSVSDTDYQISIKMTDGTILERGAEQDKSQAAPIVYSMETQGFSWKMRNTSSEKRKITGVLFDWPEDNGTLTYFEINGVEVIENAKGGSVYTSLTDSVEIDVDENIEIELSFSELTSVNDLDYGVLLEFEDGSVEEMTTTNILPIQGKMRNTYFPTLVNADKAHARGITGHGVTVAIIDTGFDDLDDIKLNTVNEPKSIQVHNVLDKKEPELVEDLNGHGTHIASIIGNSSPTVDLNGQLNRSYSGIAPDANLVIVKAFDEEGRANYNKILRAIEYVIENKDTLNIKVLNLSFSATPSSYYWDDPINQAVMRAWEAGITVVAAAGNQGPDAMTIGVPGNTPYIITVGAMSDNYTPNNTADDFVTTFSSAGPTFEGFVKPDMVAPGGHIQGLMDSETYIGTNYPIYHDEKSYFVLSGSSQSTAITSGIVALMLQNDPSLSPDDIKCRLMYTAKVAVTDDGNLAHSVFQQGAGLVDAISAIDESAVGCGNAGLDIAADLAGEDHFIGPARRHDNDGDFYIPGTEGLDWNGVYQDSQLWGNVRFLSNSQLWGNVRFDSSSQLWGNISNDNNDVTSDSQLWGNVRFNSNSQLWGNIRFESDSQLWGNVRFLSDSQLWGNVHFNSNSQLWGNVKFQSDTNSQGQIRFDDSSFDIKWVDQE